MSVPTKQAVHEWVVDEAAYHAGVPKKLIKDAHKLKDDLDMNRQDLVRFSRALRDYMAHEVCSTVVPRGAGRGTWRPRAHAAQRGA